MGVIVPKEVMKEGDEEVNAFIDNVMEPYSEEKQVNPYLDKDKDEVKAEFNGWKRKLNEAIKSKKPLQDYEQKYVENGKIKPITLKEWCKSWGGWDLEEDGTIMTTWNNDSFYDYYRVGGRWDGVITGNEQESDNGFNGDSQHETVKNNSILISELLTKAETKDKEIDLFRKGAEEISKGMNGIFNGFGFADLLRKLVKHETLTKEEDEFYKQVEKRFEEFVKNYEFYNPFTLPKIVDTKGNLHEGKDFGWFGMSKNKESPDKWDKDYIKLLSKHKEDYIVTLDCHV